MTDWVLGIGWKEGMGSVTPWFLAFGIEIDHFLVRVLIRESLSLVLYMLSLGGLGTPDVLRKFDIQI